MKSAWICVVVVATCSLVAGDPQLFNFQIGNPPEEESDSPSANSVDSNKSPLDYLRSSAAPKGKSRFPGVTFVSDSPGEDGSSEYLGGGRPGPLNYGRPSEFESANGPSESEPDYQNDIASSYKGGKSPQISDGYRPGPPPGYRANRPRPRGRPSFESSPQGFFGGFGGPRGPPPRGPRGPPSSASQSPENGYQFQRSPTESLPVRIGRGLMGLLTSATTNPSSMLSVRPNFFSPPRNGPMYTSSSDQKVSTLYLAPPPKDAPSFYGGVRSPYRSLKSAIRSLKSPISLITSESNNQFHRDYYSPSAQQIVPQFAHPQRAPKNAQQTFQITNVPSQFQNQVFVNPRPSQTVISQSQPQQQSQLVRATGPDGQPVFYQISNSPSTSSFQPSQQTQPQLIRQEQQQPQIFRQEQQPQILRQEQQQPQILRQEQQPQIQYISQPPQGPSTLTLASRPDIPFPSLTNSPAPSQFIQQGSFVGSPVQTLAARPQQPQFVSQQGGFTVTGAQSIYPSDGQLFQAPVQQQSFDLSSIQDAQFQQVLLNQLNIDQSQGIRSQQIPQQQLQVAPQQVRAQPQQQQQQFIQQAISQNTQQQPASTNGQQVQLIKPSSLQGSQFRQGQQGEPIGAFSTIEEEKETKP